MNAHEPDVVRWLLLVGATLLGAVLAGLAQRRWWRRAGAPPGPAAQPSRRRLEPGQGRPPGRGAQAPACPVCPSPAGGSGGPDARRGSARIPDEGTVMTAGPRAVILARDG